MAENTQTVEYGKSKVEEILDAVGDSPSNALAAFVAELHEKGRTTALKELGPIAAQGEEVAGWAENGQIVDGKARFQVARGNLQLLRATKAFEKVTDLIDAGDERARGIRLDSADPTVLDRLSVAFYEAAREMDSMTDIRSMLALGRMAAMQSQAAAAIPEDVPEVDTAEDVEDPNHPTVDESSVSVDDESTDVTTE